MAATANGSSSPLRTPADPTYVRPKKCLNSPAAIGERTELSPHANNTACGLAERGASISPLPVQHADQREQAPCGVEVEANLFLQALHQELGALVVQPAPAHIDR